MIVLEESARVGRVADSGFLGDSEHGRQVQGIAVAGEGFLELPIDPQPFQVRGQTPQVQDERGADRAVLERAFLRWHRTSRPRRRSCWPIVPNRPPA
jgi:hypothetical protein